MPTFCLVMGYISKRDARDAYFTVSIVSQYKAIHFVGHTLLEAQPGQPFKPVRFSKNVFDHLIEPPPQLDFESLTGQTNTPMTRSLMGVIDRYLSCNLTSAHTFLTNLKTNVQTNVQTN